MTPTIQHFLLVFDRATGRPRPVEEFGEDSVRALQRYQELEQEQQTSRHSVPDLDVVLVGSESLDNVRVTHASYFTDADTAGVPSVEAYLRGFAAHQTAPRTHVA